MTQIVVYSLAAGIATLAGAAAILSLGRLSRKTTSRLMGFGSGVLAAAAFLHLIPDSVEMSPSRAGWALLVGLLFFIAVEQFVHTRTWEHHHHPADVVGVMGFIALFIHSLVDGLAITVGFRASHELGLVTAVAVIAHEVPEGITSVSLFRTAGYAPKIVFLLALLVAVATPGAALISWFSTSEISSDTLAILLAFAASSFIYVATADILPRLHEQRDIPSFLYLLLGVLIPVVLTLIES